MQIQLKTHLRHAGDSYRAGEIVESEAIGLDERQLRALLEHGSAERYVTVETAAENGEVEQLRKALAAANAANEALRAELSAVRAQVEVRKPLADENDRARARAKKAAQVDGSGE